MPAVRSSGRLSEVMASTGVVAILRGVPNATAVELARELHGAGIDLIEVALSEAGALEQLAAVAEELGQEALVGAGTVTSLGLARAARDAGASFLVTPHVVPDVNGFARLHAVPVIGGAMTPTEIATAREQGNAFVKVFPAGVLGPGYLRALHGPYPDAALVAVGGVDPDNAADFVRAGAVGVAVGDALTRRAGEPGRAGEVAYSLLRAVAQAKGGRG